MSQLTTNQQEDLRHERKFLIADHSAKEVEQLLKLHPACFSPLYHPRRVNNIYFDSLGFDSYYANVEGNTDRRKARIRWYGELFGPVSNSILEFKIKKGLLGKKELYTLAPFTMDTNFSKQQIVNALSTESIPLNVRNLMLSVQPVLLNTYSRKYFISADKEFRITIDSELTYYRISYNGATFLNKVTDHNAVVLELKYNSDMEHEAKEIGSSFPFAMTKNSKYQQGIERVLF